MLVLRLHHAAAMSKRSSWLVGLALGLGGCTGTIADGDVAEQPAGTAAPGDRAASTPTPTGGTSGAPAPAPAAACKDGKIDPGPVYLRRLTNAEYAVAVKDLLGIDPSNQVATFPSDLSARQLENGMFDNQSKQQTISDLHGSRYFAAAQDLSSAVLSSADAKARVFGCDPAAGGAACMKAFVERFGRRAYRRPVTAEESQALLALFSSDPEPVRAAGLVLQAMLMSPTFLYRVEVGSPTRDAARPDLVKLTGYEVASRLAFLMFGRAPDDALLDAAAAGALDTPDGVERVARGWFRDARFHDAMLGFAAQWLQTTKLPRAQRDPAIYPRWKPELAASMGAEVAKLLEDHMLDPAASFFDLLTSGHGYVDAQLAPIYGVSTPAGKGLVKTTFPAGSERGGLFTTAGFLTATTRGNETSVIHRGLYVRDVILCDQLPPPPPNVMPSPPQPGESPLDTQARHRADPACASCHNLIDPVGTGLERFGAIGELRASYPNGKPVPKGGEITGLTTPGYAGGVELGRVLHDEPRVRACAVAHLFRWAAGRSEGETGANDACTLADLTARFRQAKDSFPELVVALVRSDAFRYRRTNASE
jgi:hypothetical protein